MGSPSYLDKHYADTAGPELKGNCLRRTGFYPFKKTIGGLVEFLLGNNQWFSPFSFAK